MAYVKNQKIVIDNGTSSTKAGFTGDAAPSAIFDTLYGTPKELAAMEAVANADSEYIGSRAQDNRGILALKYPIENGIIKDFEIMEKIWAHTFSNELRKDPCADEMAVYLTEPSMNPKKPREKVAEIMFEKFNVPAIDIGDANVCALMAFGQTTGVSVDMGAGTIMAVPIVKGFVIANGIQRMNFAGTDLTKYLKKLLTERQLEAAGDLDSPTGQEIVRELKENIIDYGAHKGKSMMYVAEDYKAELEKSKKDDELNADYELPDGQEITVESERFRCPEGLFNPKMMGKKDVKGLHESVYAAINGCEQDTRRDLYKNIVLSGGTSSFDGLADRLDKEIEGLAPHLSKAKLKGKDMVSVYTGKTHTVTKIDPTHIVWCGAMATASSTTQDKKWFTRAEYDSGVSIHDKVLGATEFE